MTRDGPSRICNQKLGHARHAAAGCKLGLVDCRSIDPLMFWRLLVPAYPILAQHLYQLPLRYEGSEVAIFILRQGE